MSQGKIRRYDTKINAISRLIDSGIILLTFWALSDTFEITWEPLHVWIVLFSVILFNFFAESQDAYRSWRGASLKDEIHTVLLSWLATAAVLIILTIILTNQKIYTQVFISLWLVVTPIEIVSWHAIVRMSLGLFRRQGFNTRTVAILGATELGQRLENSFKEMAWTGYHFIGYYDDRQQAIKRRLSDESTKVVGNIDQLMQDCKVSKVDTVIITLAMSAEARIKDITSELADTTASVYLVPDLFTFNLLNSRWVDFQGISAVSIYETPFAGVDSMVKRIEDIVLSLIILTLIAIPMSIIALSVKLTSKGPVFFKQTRYGVDGEKIKVWKFRSMTVSEDGESITQAKKNDKRITRFGAFLRKTSLDELPQFFNSLGGSMSIVGPRPHAVAHNEEYRSQIHGYMLRHKVKPGITGLAQINGYRGETDTLDKMAGRVKYDLQYIQTWTLMLDLKIIILTVFKGFVGENVY